MEPREKRKNKKTRRRQRVHMQHFQPLPNDWLFYLDVLTTKLRLALSGLDSGSGFREEHPTCLVTMKPTYSVAAAVASMHR